MVAFAVGGLLGDTLFHLLPEIFLGEDPHDKVKFVMVEPNKNLLLGVAIMAGFITFVAMDKGLRIATGGAGGHDHSHGHAHEKTESTAIATGAELNGILYRCYLCICIVLTSGRLKRRCPSTQACCKPLCSVGHCEGAKERDQSECKTRWLS
jgi:hypothetical protein